MKPDIGKDLANKLYRLVMSVVPMHKGAFPAPPDKRAMGWRFGHGNTYLQTGRVVFDDEYAAIRDRALTHEFPF